jgi:hypothetical protein
MTRQLGRIRPSKSVPNQWRAAYVAAPHEPFRVVARDADPKGWLAFSAPIGMASGSYWCWRLASHAPLLTWISAGLLLVTFLRSRALAKRTKGRSRHSQRREPGGAAATGRRPVRVRPAMLRLLLPPNLSSAAARDAIAIKVELDLSRAPGTSLASGVGRAAAIRGASGSAPDASIESRPAP